MSYYSNRNGGGGRRHHRDDRRQNHRDGGHHHREAHHVDNTETKLRNNILKFADDINTDPSSELPRFSNYLREHLPAHSATIAEGFRLGVTEQPYKIPFYAGVLSHLHNEALNSSIDPEASGDNALATGVNESDLHVGVKAVIEDIIKGFQGYLDKLAWRELKLCACFFAHLVQTHTISPTSLVSLLQSFASVLDEPGVSFDRAHQAALCVGEALIHSGSTLYTHDTAAVNDLITSLKTYSDGLKSLRAAVSPIVPGSGSDVGLEPECKETIISLVSALEHLRGTSFTVPVASLPRPQEAFTTPKTIGASSFELPFVLVPPEAFELDDDMSGPSSSTTAGPSSAYTYKAKSAFRQNFPYVYLSLFPDDVTPNDQTPGGYVVRSCMIDMLNIFEVNRKENARLTLDLPRWFHARTFDRDRQVDDEDDNDNTEVEKMEWNLECLAIETILSTTFLLPVSPHLGAYYYALITDLCKLSPQTVGPAVGKSIRRLYKFLGNGLDVEVAKRFAEWFAIHMSNFSFNWVWKEWIPDLSFAQAHPQKRFIKRAIELEIRLSYHDRIKGSLPADFLEPEPNVFPQEPPAGDYEYDSTDHPYHNEAEALLNLVRGRSKADEVLKHAESMRNNLTGPPTNLSPHMAATVVRSISMQVLLHVGSRSFSHFLNAIERYLSLLRSISNREPSTSSSALDVTQAKAEILDIASRYWRRSSQMVAIVFDKLMQYQVVDPEDVVSWSFRGQSRDHARLSAKEWDILKAALEKANGRVLVAKGKVQSVKKVEEDAKARLKAKQGGDVGDEGMDVETSVPEDSVQSQALSAALKAHATLTRDQKAALLQALDGFISALGSPGTKICEHLESWSSRETWEQEEWESWETYGWYRQFCREFSPQLKVYMNTLESISLSKLDALDATDQAASKLLRRVWSVALDQE
ncbi:hypothetical protein FRC02_005873 [Tulasnella sp. 418]|nr:hypothetical protein FRC02_005873 [Tulasnella sp. 418]